MRVTPNRRLVLQSIIAGLSFRPAISAAQDLPELTVLQRWSTGNAVLNPMTFADGRLLIAGDKTVGAITLDAAEPLWLHPHGFDKPAGFRPRPIAGQVVCGGRSWLAAYDVVSGAELWRHPAEIQTGVPFVTPSHTFFGDGHWLLALDTVTGAELWRFAAVPDTIMAYAPVADGETVYVAPGDGRLYAVAISDGSLRWSIDGREHWQYLRQITIEGGLLVAGTYHENLKGISLEDGHEVWSFYAGNFINSQLVRDGSAYLWSPTGWIYAINTATGAVRWRYQTTDYDGTASNWAAVQAELQSLDGKLYALTLDHVLHRLDTATGTEHLEVKVPDKIRYALTLIEGRGIAFPTESAEVLLTAFP
ncbi:MAG: PQQ-binding-like beta-propeller repeat protein [Rhodobacterales bacterium]|nr:PQQ-binding-like beta-propeller repeat protein [Rhodobacterales bacterium]